MAPKVTLYMVLETEVTAEAPKVAVAEEALGTVPPLQLLPVFQSPEAGEESQVWAWAGLKPIPEARQTKAVVHRKERNRRRMVFIFSTSRDYRKIPGF